MALWSQIRFPALAEEMEMINTIIKECKRPHWDDDLMSDSLELLTRHSPCRRPMRKRDTVMETMGCEQKWARMGVNAVMAPHAAAESNITFSPPTLFTTQTRAMNTDLLKTFRGSLFKEPSRVFSELVWNGRLQPPRTVLREMTGTGTLLKAWLITMHCKNDWCDMKQQD